MKIGIIGGSGLYALDGLTKVEEVAVHTPFGDPSDVLVHGVLSGVDVYFLPRHGRGHRILPSEINHRANIHALKQMGVDAVVSVSAVGSLREELRPRDVVLPDQYYDRTKRSADHTFFGHGVVAHVSFAEPCCPSLRALLAEATRDVIGKQSDVYGDVEVHDYGTYVNMEGPAFSTRAESHVYRSLKFDVIGMTSLAEAKLCREAELCYQAMAMVTDYDCWHEAEEPVTVDMVVAHLSANTALAKAVLPVLFRRLKHREPCQCGTALAHALMTQRDMIPAERRTALALIIGKYL